MDIFLLLHIKIYFSHWCERFCGTCAAGEAAPQALHIDPCTVQGSDQGGYSLSSEREYPPLTPKRKGFTLQASSSKSCDACRIGCLLFFAAIRFDFLLSSLPLCLRFVTLTQFPSTTDLCRLAFACQGGIALLAAVRIIEIVHIVDSR